MILQGSRRINGPELSPDGNRLAYASFGVPQNIYVANLDGSGERKLTQDDTKEWGPRWSPDGERLAYYSDRSSTFQTWTVNQDGSRAERHTQFDQPTLLPLFSPDGSRIAFTVRNERPRLIDATRTYESQEYDVLPLPPGRDGVEFSVSDWRETAPEIVGNAGGVVTYSLETGRFELLVDGAVRLPRWMADGRIIYQRRNPFGVFVVDPSTGEERQVEGVPEAEAVFLSPDNRRLYWLEQVVESDIFALEFSGR